MRLLLIRHGETDWNVEARIQGVADIPLNDRGRRQAELLGEALAGEPISAVFASPLQRAQHTAECVALHHRLAVRTHPGLSELDQGVLEGLLAKDLREHPAGIVQAWEAGNMSIVIPGGESMEGLQQRAWSAIEAIRDQAGPDGVVAVVSHNLTTKAIICSALGLPLITYRRLRKDNGSVSVLELQATHNILVRLNDVSHYATLAAPSATNPPPSAQTERA